MYVEELIGPETVNTMPAETVAAFQDHGKVVADTITEGLAEARKLLERLAEVGVDYDDVVATLEAEGVQKFADSFEELLDGIRAKRSELAARVSPIVERIWALRRVALDRLGRGSLARLARRRHARPAARRRAERVRGGGDRAVPRLRAARHGRLVARARGAATDVQGRVVPRPRHHPPRGDPAARAERRPRADAVHRLLEVGLDDRDALAPGVLLAADRRPRSAVRRDHRSGLGARAAGERARLPGHLRRRAGDRRPLLGALDVRDRAGRADGRRRRALPAGARPR